ncbi:hypothetical protein HFN59_02240 [Rhizobium leguminosarum]|uniref:hypothetical protein n=1 Tax=Rhizobium leguminosarum TaxID=384 RepID=UPI001C96A83C|nr:hypothetical protein [Rhizobium leguminosarum]MBY5775943.1 hypothetical protein [Rhizobium leguminosarum]
MIDTQPGSRGTRQASFTPQFLIGACEPWSHVVTGFNLLRNVEIMNTPEALYLIDEALRSGHHPTNDLAVPPVICRNGMVYIDESLIPKLIAGLQELASMAASDRLGMFKAQVCGRGKFRPPVLDEKQYQAIMALAHYAPQASMICDSGNGFCSFRHSW